MTVTKKGLAATIIVLILALCLSACDLFGSPAEDIPSPVEDTLEEYEYHMELLESEALLGMTKEEVHETLGQPDVWRKQWRGLGKLSN